MANTNPSLDDPKPTKRVETEVLSTIEGARAGLIQPPCTRQGAKSPMKMCSVHKCGSFSCEAGKPHKYRIRSAKPPVYNWQGHRSPAMEIDHSVTVTNSISIRTAGFSKMGCPPCSSHSQYPCSEYNSTNNSSSISLRLHWGPARVTFVSHLESQPTPDSPGGLIPARGIPTAQGIRNNNACRLFTNRTVTVIFVYAKAGPQPIAKRRWDMYLQRQSLTIACSAFPNVRQPPLSPLPNEMYRHPPRAPVAELPFGHWFCSQSKDAATL